MSDSRRSFLKKSLLSTALVALPGNALLAESRGRAARADALPLVMVDVLAYLRRSKKRFYEKKYDAAAALARKAIEAAPGNVACYDALARVLAAQQQHLAVAELYRRAWHQNNEEQVAFYDRYARSLMRLSMGHSPQERQFVEKYGETDLLERAAQLYLQAAGRAPGKRYLRKGLRQVVRKFDQKTVHTHFGRAHAQSLGRRARRGTERAARKAARRLLGDASLPETPNTPLTEQSTAELKARLGRVDRRVRRPLHTAQEKAVRGHNIRRVKKRHYFELSRRALEEERYEAAESHYQQVRRIDPADTESIGALRRMYRKQGRYEDLLELARENAERQETVWSELAVAKALRKMVAGGEGTNEQLDEALALYEALLREYRARNALVLVSCYDGAARCYVLAERYGKARGVYEKALGELPEPKRHLVNTLGLGLAKTYISEEKSEQAKLTMRALVGEASPDEDALPTAPTLLKAVGGLPSNPEEKRYITVYHALAKLHRTDGDEQAAKAAYEHIVQIQPKDEVAQRFLKELA